MKHHAPSLAERAHTSEKGRIKVAGSTVNRADDAARRHTGSASLDAAELVAQYVRAGETSAKRLQREWVTLSARTRQAHDLEFYVRCLRVGVDWCRGE